METKRVCKFCGKPTADIGGHLARWHPAILDQLDENFQKDGQIPIVTPVVSNLPVPNPRIGDISTLIREKLDIMLNIKIIEMLSKSPNTSIQEIAASLNPPQMTPLDELARYHKVVYGEENMPIIETGNQWVDIAQQALPIVKEMMASRKQKTEVYNDVRSGETTSSAILKPIQLKTPGNSREPGSIGQEPGIIGNTEQ